ncbi:MAG: hypothetical protein K2H64_09450 [Desulfovibrio sp.]|nr:hypothetical protein [Desulfovibrio sp.]
MEIDVSCPEIFAFAANVRDLPAQFFIFAGSVGFGASQFGNLIFGGVQFPDLGFDPVAQGGDPVV